MKINEITLSKSNMRHQTQIIIRDYPYNFSFKTSAKLPKFKEFKRCKVRQKLLLSAMRRLKIYSPSHAYTDYVVETVCTSNCDDRCETWELGT